MVVVVYLKPLIIHRLKTKKIKVIVIGRNGEKEVNTLYLYPDDPLWKAIEIHKGGNHE